MENGRSRGRYAVLWRDNKGEICTGALIIGKNSLRLEGTNRKGEHRSVELSSAASHALRIGRAAADRLDGRTSLVMQTGEDRTLILASAAGVGMIHEMADRLASAGFGLERPS
jgi:hypothetical protein